MIFYLDTFLSYSSVNVLSVRTKWLTVFLKFLSEVRRQPHPGEGRLEAFGEARQRKQGRSRTRSLRSSPSPSPASPAEPARALDAAPAVHHAPAAADLCHATGTEHLNF